MKKKLLIAGGAITAALCVVAIVLCCIFLGGRNEDGGHIHKLMSVGEKSATCTANGHKAYYICTGCDKWFEDEDGKKEISDRDSLVYPKGHKMTSVEEKKATCSEDGNSAYYACETCNKWFSDELGKQEIADKDSVIFRKGHKINHVSETKATCTKDGNSEYYFCENCDKWFNDSNATDEIEDKESVVFPKSHKLNAVKEILPTCTKDGNRAYYRCSSCNRFFDDEKGESEIADKTGVVLPKGHKLKTIEGREATCAQKGYIEYFICDVCDKWFNDRNGKTEITDKTSIVIKRTPHSYKDGACTQCGIHAPTEGLEYYDKGDSVEVIDIGEATDAQIVIAEEYNGKPVTSIGKRAFYCCDVVKSVILPDSITSIGDEAFYGCNLTSIIFSDNLISIGNEAFYGCDFTSITFPDSLISIGDYAFEECHKLTSITFNYSLISIGDSAFEDCSSLTSVIIPDSVTSVGKNAFIRCKSLKSVIVSANVTILEMGTFEQCSNLESVTLRGKVTWIKAYAFYDCSALKSITIPESIFYLGDNAFGWCDELTDIIFNGTRAQWDRITKATGWDNGTYGYTVHCTDGNIIVSA